MDRSIIVKLILSKKIDIIHNANNTIVNQYNILAVFGYLRFDIYRGFNGFNFQWSF